MTQDVQVMEQATPEETSERRFVSLEEGFCAAGHCERKRWRMGLLE